MNIKSKESIDSYREPTKAHKTYQGVPVCPMPLQGENYVVSLAFTVRLCK